MHKNLETLKKFIGSQNQRLQDDISRQGYKDDSPYRNNPSNTIYGTPQGTPITMKGVSTPLIGMDEFGNKQKMYPGQDYYYPGSQVTETRTAKYGGLLNKTITCSNCGWSWKAADGGNDVSTCHKCGEEVSQLLKAQYGKSVIENTQVGTSRDKRGLALEMKEHHDALKDEHELHTTGQIQRPRSVKYKQNAPRISEVRTSVPQSATSKAWEVATHPMTAAGYAVRHENLPDNFSRGPINAHEQAVNLINPAFYANEAGHFVKNVATGHPLDAAGNALNILPISSEFGPEINQGLEMLGGYGNDFIQASKTAGKVKLPTYNNAFRWQADVVPQSLVDAGKQLTAEQQALTGSWYTRNLGDIPFYMRTRRGPGNLKSIRLSDTKLANLEQHMPGSARGMSGKVQGSIETSDWAHPGELIIPKSYGNKVKDFKFEVNPAEYPAPAEELDFNGNMLDWNPKAQNRVIDERTQNIIAPMLEAQYPPLMGIPRKYFPFKEGGELPKAQYGDSVSRFKAAMAASKARGYGNTPNQAMLSTDKRTQMERESDARLSDKELERKARMRKEILAQGRGQFNSTQDFKDANGAIDTHMRVSLNDNVFDDYLNPAVWMGSMANKLGAVPDNINRGNYGQVAMAFAEPLAFGAGEEILAPYINKGLNASKNFINSKRVLPIVGNYKVPTIAESWGKYKPLISESEQGLEPYISRIGEPSISREEEVFRNVMGKDYRVAKELKNTKFFDPQGNTISTPENTYTPYVEDEYIKAFNARRPSNFLPSGLTNHRGIDIPMGDVRNINLNLFGFGKKPTTSILTSLQKEALFADQELARANADAATFSNSPFNKQKLQEFRPNQEFNVSNQQARFVDDPVLDKQYQAFRNNGNLDYPETIAEQLGNSRGDYLANGYGDMNDVITIDKFRPSTSNVPTNSAYTDAMHEITHSRSIRLKATPQEQKIASEAWEPMIKNNDFGMPAEEAFAVQNELRSSLGDIKGNRIYTEKDIPEIKNKLQNLINTGHEYLRGTKVEDFNMSSLIKSLNKIGLGAVFPATIGVGAAANMQQKKYGGPIYNDNDLQLLTN